MSSVLSRLKKTWLQKGAEQKAKCDIRPAGNMFSQELLSAARMLLWIVRRHRGISRRREWLQDNLSSSVCGDPRGGAQRILFTARRTQITFSAFSVSSSCCFLIHYVGWTEAKLSCCFYGCGLFSSQGQSQNRRPKPDTSAGAQRHVSRAELWEILRHIEVSKTQIRPTPGTFYFCFSDSPGHTQLGDLLNKTPPRDLEVNKHYRLINKVWQNCHRDVARCQQTQQLRRYRWHRRGAADIMTCGRFLKHPWLFSVKWLMMSDEEMPTDSLSRNDVHHLKNMKTVFLSEESLKLACHLLMSMVLYLSQVGFVGVPIWYYQNVPGK